MNNNMDDSPIGLSNTAAGTTPNSNDSSSSPGEQRNSKQNAINSQFQLLGEDLQKIRQSSHHSLHLQGAAARREIINDTQLDDVIMGGGGGGGRIRDLLYPALEDSFSDSQRSFGVDLMEDCDRYTSSTLSAVGGQPYMGTTSSTTHHHQPQHHQQLPPLFDASTASSSSTNVLTSTSTLGSSTSLMMVDDGLPSRGGLSGAGFGTGGGTTGGSGVVGGGGGSITPGATFLEDVRRGETDSRQLTEYLNALQRVGRSSSSSRNQYSDDPSMDKLRRR